MITGIFTIFLFILVCLKYPAKKFEFQKLNRILTKIHRPAAFLLLIMSILHMIAVLPLLKARPVYVIISGFFGMLILLIGGINGMLMRRTIKKQLRSHRFLALAACFFVMLHILLNIISVVSYQNQVKSITIDTVDISGIPDGVYEGEYDVTFIYVKVSVTVKSGAITQIDILEHRNERGVPAERVIKDIIMQQKIDIDAVAGATNSSMVIQKAVENALYGA